MWILVGSLTLAFAALVAVALLSQHERGFNSALDPDAEVFQVYTQVAVPGEEPRALAAALPDLEAAIGAAVPGTRVARKTLYREPQTIEVGGSPALARIDEADPALADVLDLGGEPEDLQQVLASPDGAVATRSGAQRLFSGSKPIGSIFNYGGHSYRIGAIVDDFPENSTFSGIDLLISSTGSWTTLGSAQDVGSMLLSVGDAATFVRISRDDRERLAEVRRAADRQAEILMRRLLSGGGGSVQGAPTFTHKLIPMRAPDEALAIGALPDPRRFSSGKLAILWLLAGTVVLAAALNASSLTMARMLASAPAIAVRRAFGASRAHVASSVLKGGVLLFGLAAVLGGLAAIGLAGSLGSALGRRIDPVPDWSAAALLALLVLGAGLASAAYPAVTASRFGTGAVLSSRWANIPGTSVIRVILVALQVAVSAGTVFFALVVYQQLAFLTQADLGFSNLSAVAYKLPEPVSSDDGRTAILQSANTNGGAVSLAAALPSEGSVGKIAVRGSSRQVIEATSVSIDATYFEVLEAPLLFGRAFRTAELGSRASGAPMPVILSANLAIALGFRSPSSAVGQIVRSPSTEGAFAVIGVAPDLPVGAIRDGERPLALYQPASRPADYLIASTRDVNTRLSDVFDGTRVEEVSLAERIRTAYLDLSRIRWFASLFAGLALVTAGVGIYALAADRVTSMKIEAGVRKAFGASGLTVALLLLKRLAPVIAVGTVLGLALAAAGASVWLAGFPRREVDLLQASVVAAAVICATFITATATHAIRLGSSKPVDALRD